MRDPAVVLGAFGGVGQRPVGDAEQHHDAGGFRVVRVAVGMVLLRQAPVGRADDLGRGGARVFQVVILGVEAGHGGILAAILAHRMSELIASTWFSCGIKGVIAGKTAPTREG